jgi:co-chaperonin GroES (HSP10)
MTVAHIDQRLLSVAPKPQNSRFELRIHDIEPEDLEPLGDRYIVEVIDFDESKVLLGQLLVVTQQPKTAGNPNADPNVEGRGVFAAVVVEKGNGHLLGLPDPRVVVTYSPQHAQMIERVSADVPMFCEPGDVVFVDHNARGRGFKILGKECRVINQIDILARYKKMQLKRTEDGGWEPQ